MVVTRNTTQPTTCQHRREHWCRSDDGSILIPVAVCLLGLLTFSAFTIDNGVMLSSRRQAQNAADAGAMAAGLYLAWDDSTDQPGAQAAGVAAAQLHQVWDDIPDVTLADVTFPPCPPGAPGPVDQCVRVDVFRNQRPGGNPLPAFFASLAGVTDQGVRATATAQIVYGDSADCLLPFAIPDRWREVRDDWSIEPPPGMPTGEDDNTISYPDDDAQGPPDEMSWWDPEDTFDVVEQVGNHGGDPLTGIIDIYNPGPAPVVPTPYNPLDPLDPVVLAEPTGFNVETDHGMRIKLKARNREQIVPSWYYPIVLPDGLGNGANDYRYRIRNCTDVVVPEDMVFTVEPGNMRGPTRVIQDLIDEDLGAEWDPLATTEGFPGGVSGGCSATPPTPDGTEPCGRRAHQFTLSRTALVLARDSSGA